MASEWAYKIARNQRRDVETIAANLDAARIEGLEEAAKIVEDRDDFLVISPDSDKTISCIAERIRARIEEVKG